MPIRQGRKSLATQRRENARSMALYASAAPRELSADAVALATVTEAPVVRPRRKKKQSRPEGDAQDGTIAYLKLRKDVGGIVRFNGGALKTETSFVRFNTVHFRVWCEPLGKFIYPRVVDLQCIKLPGRICAIEMKPPGWTGVRTEREYCQQAYIEMVKAAGGIGGFATCIDDVQAILAS